MPKSKFATLFTTCGWIASAFLLMILILIVIQVIGRLVGISTPGIANYGGYCMSAASFYGLSYAMHHNSHIRVSLFLEMSVRLRFSFELWCHVIGTGLAAYFCYYAFKTTYYSYKFHDVSQGQDATPLWIPQLFIICVCTACFVLVLGERLYWLLGTGAWVGLALMGVAVVGIELFTSRPAGDAMLTVIWASSNSWSLIALPMFIWMGKILYRTKLSEDMFKGLAPWMSGLPGGLLHTNIVGCTIFAAVSGSSAATLTTVGKISIPELRKRDYPEKMIIGTLAGAATLGLMIPP